MNPVKVDWRSMSPAPVIGVDEVGRGCLAGPVCAGAVIFKDLHDPFLDQYDDSKKLSEIRREQLAKIIRSHHVVGIGVATVDEIEKYNILRASLLAMKRAVLSLEAKTGHLMVDGTYQVPGLKDFAQSTFVKGDQRSNLIAAASIVAKVFRDELMKDYAKEFPVYGFDANKGYGSQAHLEALRAHGPTKIHRLSFKGVGEIPPGGW